MGSSASQQRKYSFSAEAGGGELSGAGNGNGKGSVGKWFCHTVRKQERERAGKQWII